MIVAVASRNPVKVAAASSVFSSAFGDVSVRAIDPPPGLNPQPVTLESTVEGAEARSAWACASDREAAYCVGIESGFMELRGLWYAATVASIRDRSGRSSTGLGPAYPVPPRISRLVVSGGLEMEEAMERLYGEREGAVGLLSKGLSSRMELCAEAVKMALLPFLSPSDY